MSHYYDKEGKPCHFQVTQSGKNKGKERPTTSRDASKLGLFPSVTTVIGDMLRNPMLERWFQKQAVGAAVSATRGIGEDETTFTNRVIHESLQKSRDATDFGTEVHYHIEQYNLNKDYIVPPESVQKSPEMVDILEYWKDFSHKEIEEVVSAEEVLVSEDLGCAGTVDLIYLRKNVGLCIGDFKTQGVNEKYGVSFYETFPIQMALYARMYKLTHNLPEDPRISTQVINSNKTEEVHDKLYTLEEQQKSLSLGLCLLRGWFFRKGYTPKGVDLYNPSLWLS